MIEDSLKAYSLIFISLIIAILMSILPLQHGIAWLWPQWVILVVIYWALTMPERLGIGFAWIIGLLLDAVHGTLFGEHALALTLVIYIVAKFQHRILLYNFLQRTLVIFCLLVLYQSIMFLIEGLIGHMPTTWLYWLSPVTGTIFWPWIYSILQNCRRKFKLINHGMRRFSYGRD